jgi:hypothetical protein
VCVHPADSIRSSHQQTRTNVLEVIVETLVHCIVETLARVAREPNCRYQVGEPALLWNQ